MTDISGGAWISDSTANRYKQTYLKGFLDLSYGDVTLHHGNVVLKGENRSGGSGGDLIVEIGNVGIGTSAPQYMLDVSGQIAGQSESIFYRTTALAKAARSHSVLTLENDANTATYSHGKPTLSMGWNGTDAWAFGQGATTGVGGLTTTLGLGTGNNTTTDAYGWTPTFNFTNNGHMGIGTNAPTSELEVVGTITAPNYIISDSAFTGFDGIVKGMYGMFHSATDSSTSDGLNIGANDYNGRLGMSIVNDGANSLSASLQFHTHHSGSTWRTPMTIKYNGNVGIGTDAPTCTLDVNGPIRSTSVVDTTHVEITSGSNGGYKIAYIDFSCLHADYDGRIMCQGTTGAVGSGTMRYEGSTHTFTGNGSTTTLNVDGNLQIGNILSSSVASQSKFTFQSSNEPQINSSSSTSFLFATNGYAYGTLWVDSSDRRLKRDIKPLSNALETIQKLNPVHYNKRSNNSLECDYESDEDTCYNQEDGFIAQEIQEIPELNHSVSHSISSEMLGLNYNCILSYCVKAIQEQQQQIEEMKAKLETIFNA